MSQKPSEPDMSLDEMMKSVAIKATTGKRLALFVDFVVEHAGP